MSTSMSTWAALALGAVGSFGGFEAFNGHGGRAEAQTFSVLELEAKGALDDIPMGSATAPVTIIEYASMTCPHCAAFTVNTFPKLKEKYIDTGKVKYVMREYPLDGLAAAAFMLARCAGPEKYYALIETLFAQQQKWAVREPLPPHAAARLRCRGENATGSEKSHYVLGRTTEINRDDHPSTIRHEHLDEHLGRAGAWRGR